MASPGGKFSEPIDFLFVSKPVSITCSRAGFQQWVDNNTNVNHNYVLFPL